MVQIKYYFARLHTEYDKDYYGSDKENFIYRTLEKRFIYNSSPNYYSIKNLWTITNIELLNMGSNTRLLYGELINFKNEEEEEIFNESYQERQTKIINNRIQSKVHFFLDIKTAIIGYTTTKKINRKTFMKRFCQIFLQTHNNLFLDVEMYPVEQKNYNFMGDLKKLHVLKTIEINLVPSNPNADPIWDKYDEKIRNKNASKYQEKYISNDSEGLDTENISNDSEIYAKVQMAQDGYGQANASGYEEDNGDFCQIKTGSHQLEEKVNYNENDNEAWAQLKKLIKNVFTKVKNDFNQEVK